MPMRIFFCFTSPVKSSTAGTLYVPAPPPGLTIVWKSWYDVIQTSTCAPVPALPNEYKGLPISAPSGICTCPV